LTDIVEDTAQAELCMEILLESKYYDNNSRKLAEYLNIERKYTKWTALQMAAIAGHSLLLGMLIRAGADALKVDHVGRNVFHRSAGHGRKHAKLDHAAYYLFDLI